MVNRITNLEVLKLWLAEKKPLTGMTVVNLDLTKAKINWDHVDVNKAYFLGCVFASETEARTLRKGGAIILDRFKDLPYDPFRTTLYSPQELMVGDAEGPTSRLDAKIYGHYLEQGGRMPAIQEALSQRIHDYAIDSALNELLQVDENGDPTQKVIAFAGGHRNTRGTEFYRKTAELAHLFAAEGYLIATGGGPGIMEAANLGAYLSKYPQSVLDAAIKTLSTASDEKEPDYLRRAWEVVGEYPDGTRSLAIPTWYYGHELTNQFATDIAKYFANSIREEGLLTIALYGVVFAPGSAGTRQEIFMDAAQNYYGTLDGKYDWYSPMAFLGTRAYLIETQIFQIVSQTANANYKDLLTISDSVAELHAFITSHPPIKTLHKPD